MTAPTAPTAPTVIVRPAADDAEILAAGELTAQAYQADRLVEPQDAYLEELTDARRRAAEGVLLVAVLRDRDQDVVVGTITLAPYGTSYAETAEPGEMELRMLAVAPEARGRGVAETIMRATTREAALRGYRRIVLATMEAMTTAQRLYDRLGWQRAPERDWNHEEVRLLVYTWQAPPGPGAGTELAMWRPIHSEEVAGFTLGMSDGLTRRANSAVLTSGEWDRLSAAELDERLVRIEAAYRLSGLAPCLRVDHDAVLRADDGESEGERVTEALAARGYRLVTPSLVLVRKLDGMSDPHAGEAVGASKPVVAGNPREGGPVEPSDARLAGDPVGANEPHETGPRVDVADAPDEEWLATWRGPDDDPAHREAGRALVTNGAARFLTARAPDGSVAGVVRVALARPDRAVPDAHTWAGLAGLTVAERARGRGVGRALVEAALAQARTLGADHAFVQVLARNEPALAIFERLGFEVSVAYSYAERVSD